MDWPEWRCPQDLTLLARGDNQLRCERGHEYVVHGGIPRFVAASSYADSFGAQWNRHRTTQLDSHTGLPISLERAHRCLGDELWESLADRQVLDCGCGAGRFTEVLLARGAVVTSVDLSSAVDANAANFPPTDRHRIAQADISALPFEPRAFDLVFCLGVVQHTPNPEATIARLYEQVRPGGWLVFDHYSYRASWYLSTAPLARRVFLRMSPEDGIRHVEWLVERMLPLHRRAATRPVARRLLNRISPVVTFHATLPELADDLQREWALLDTHDSLTDRYKHFRTVSQIQRALRQLDLHRISVWKAGNGIEARGCRGVE